VATTAAAVTAATQARRAMVAGIEGGGGGGQKGRAGSGGIGQREQKRVCGTAHAVSLKPCTVPTDLLILCCRLLQDLHSLLNGCWTGHFVLAACGFNRYLADQDARIPRQP